MHCTSSYTWMKTSIWQDLHIWSWLFIRMYNVHSWSLIKCWNDKNMNMVLYQQRIKSLARICFFFIPWEFFKCSSLLFLSIFLFRFTTFTSLPIYSFYANSTFFEKNPHFSRYDAKSRWYMIWYAFDLCDYLILFPCCLWFILWYTLPLNITNRA